MAGGGVAGAHAASRDDKIGKAANRTGEAAVGGAEAAKSNLEKAAKKFSDAGAELDEKLGVSDKLDEAKATAAKHLGAEDEKLKVTEKLDSAKNLAGKHLGSALSTMKSGYPFS